jgi:hypothetical protein
VQGWQKWWALQNRANVGRALEPSGAEVACCAVPRSFVLSADSPGSVDRIGSTFRDEDYWQARLVAFDTGSPTLDSLTTDADGTTSVAMTLSFGGDQLPAPLNRIRAGVVHVHHLERWCPDDDGSLRGEITVDAPGMPMSGHGAVTLTPDGDGARFACTATVAVNVPFVGGTIAKLIADPVADWILAIHEFTNAWMVDNGGPPASS